MEIRVRTEWVVCWGGEGRERRGVSGRREQKEVRVGGERGGRSEQMVTCWSSQSLDSRLTNGSKSRTLEHIHNNIHDTIHYDAKEHFAFYSTDIFHDLPQTLREADSSVMFCRHPKTHQFFFHWFFFFSVCWTHCALQLFYILPRPFVSISISFSLGKKNLLQRTEHSSQWNCVLQKWTSSSMHVLLY